MDICYEIELSPNHCIIDTKIKLQSYILPEPDGRGDEDVVAGVQDPGVELGLLNAEPSFGR